MSLSLKKAFDTLGIKYTSDQMPKMKFVQKRFYQLSMIHHPDRPGGDNDIQQKLTEAFQFIGDYILQNYFDQDDSEEEAARNVFKNFDFKNIKENLFSFTIKIDNNLSNIWETVLSAHDRKSNGKHWKHKKYSDDNSNVGDISIGK